MFCKQLINTTFRSAIKVTAENHRNFALWFLNIGDVRILEIGMRVEVRADTVQKFLDIRYKLVAHSLLNKCLHVVYQLET